MTALPGIVYNPAMTDIEEKKGTRLEIQNIIWLFYILAVGIGMLFEYQKYSRFGINIFDYADIFDFLLAPLADPKILLFSLAAMLISWALLSLDRIVERRFPRVHRFISPSIGMERRMGRRVSRFVTSALTVIIFLFASSLVMRDLAVQEILAQKPIHIRFHDNEVKTGIEIGKTREVLFLKSGQEVKAIPLTTLVKEFDAR